MNTRELAEWFEDHMQLKLISPLYAKCKDDRCPCNALTAVVESLHRLADLEDEPRTIEVYWME